MVKNGLLLLPALMFSLNNERRRQNPGKGWTPEDWSIMNAAELRPLTPAGHMGTTPDAIYAEP